MGILYAVQCVVSGGVTCDNGVSCVTASSSPSTHAGSKADEIATLVKNIPDQQADTFVSQDILVP